jgi:TatD DNase family protein
MLIDTHAHIYAGEFAQDSADMIQRAQSEGVHHIFMPNIDVSSIDAMHALEDKYDFCHAMMGLHPCYVKDDYLTQLDLIEKHLQTRSYYGVGEVGIDLYWDKTYAAEQQIAFERQISWAKDLSLPIIIHSRDSLDITIETISRLQDGHLSGIFHCFNGTVEQAKQIMDLGFLMGVGGVITYKNAGMDQVFPHCPVSSLVLETDAPYLSPVPYRGKRNEPAYIAHIAQRLADIMEMSMQDLVMTTSASAKQLFGI